jgi:hypothetical protein
MKTKTLLAVTILLIAVALVVTKRVIPGAGAPGLAAQATEGKERGAEEQIFVENRVDLGGKIADNDFQSQMRRNARVKSITFATNKNFDENIRRSISDDEEKMNQLVDLVTLRDTLVADRLDPYIKENGFTLEITYPGQNAPSSRTVLYGDDAALLAMKLQYGADVDEQIKNLLTEDEFQRFNAAEELIRLRLYGVMRVDLVLADQDAGKLDEQARSLLLDSLVRNNPDYNSGSINYFNEKVLTEARSFLGETEYAALVQANARNVILESAIVKARQVYEANGKNSGTVVINNQNGAAKFVPTTVSKF